MKGCNQCGKCCIKYGDGGIEATADEIDMWELFRPDIYKYVQKGKLWFDPETSKKLSYCPFLEKVPVASHEQTKYTCGIYQDRPEDCRHYPTSIEEMVRDECEMIEIVDLGNPRKAQIILDNLMEDSRPAKE